MKNLFRLHSIRCMAMMVTLAFSLPSFSQNDCVDFVYFDIVVVQEDADQAVVDILVSNFEDISSFQFSLNYDQAVYNLDAVDSHPNLQSSVQFNGQLDQGAGFAWIEIQGAGATVEDGNTLMTLRFSKDGDGDSSFIISDDPIGIEMSRFSNGFLDMSVCLLMD